MSGGQRRFFISYAHGAAEDEQLRTRFADALAVAGHEIFFDEKMKFGSKWADEIERQLHECDFFLLLLSEHALQSELVLQEVERVHYRRKSGSLPLILTIRVKVEGALPYRWAAYLNAYQWRPCRSDADFQPILEEILEVADAGEDALAKELPAPTPVKGSPRPASSADQKGETAVVRTAWKTTKSSLPEGSTRSLGPHMNSRHGSQSAPTLPSLDVDVLVFGASAKGMNDWEPESLGDVLACLQTIGSRQPFRVSFNQVRERPSFPSLQPDEWLAGEVVRPLLKDRVHDGRPLIAITNHRLALDYFGDTYPEDGTAIISTYNNHQIPRTILERQYLAYSLAYCTLDLALNPKLWHSDARGCLFDQVNAPVEIGQGLHDCKLCNDCRRRIQKAPTPQALLLHFIEATLAWVKNGAPPAPSTGTPIGPRSLGKPVNPKGPNKRTVASPAGRPTPPRHARNNYLALNRDEMQRVLRDRFGVTVDADFAERPRDVTKLLSRLTTQLAPGRHQTATSVRSLVRANHNTDVLYLDIPEKRHRDHSLHQLYVALAGFIFLDMQMPVLEEKPRPLIKHVTLKSFIASRMDVNPDTVDWAWYATAILHDHAYPLSHTLARTTRLLRFAPEMGDARGVRERLRNDVNMYQHLMAPRLDEHIQGALRNEAWKGRPNADAFEQEYSAILETGLARCVSIDDLRKRMASLRYDHGVVGAANLALHVSDRPPKYWHDVCRAIFDHNLEDDIVLEDRPLAFLLKLADTIQEWDRRVFPPGGTIVRESEEVTVGPFGFKGNDMVVDGPLELGFKFARAEVLQQTSWKEELWREGTKKHLRLLRNRREAFFNIDKMSISYAQQIR